MFLNTGDGRFVDFTKQSGLGDEGFAFGACFADVDNDGDLDCYITNYGPNQLYLNDGKGVFSKTENANGAQNEGLSTGAAFADINNDGFVDLFVGQYAEFSKEIADEKGTLAPYYGIMAFIGPSAYKPSADNLFLNNGDGTFRDVSKEHGLIPFEEGRAFTGIWSDLDRDGDLDLYIANDTNANHLFKNTGDGFFEEIALIAGTALSEDGTEQGGMGVAIRDFNSDLLPDIFVTNYQGERNILYENQGDLQFIDSTLTKGFGFNSVNNVGFGVVVEDFDNDGFADAVVLNGHVYPQAEGLAALHGYAQRNQIFHNQSGEILQDISDLITDINALKGISRGAASADFDHDGDLDIVVNNLDGKPFFFENISPTKNWLQIDVRNQYNMPAYGTGVLVKCGETHQFQEVFSSNSFLSQNSHILHFGLGDEEKVDEIVAQYSGAVQVTKPDISSNQRVTIVIQQ